MLIKLFEKYQLSIDTYNICLRSAPTLPLSLDQPVKHLLLDDLVVTGKSDYAIFFSLIDDKKGPSLFFLSLKLNHLTEPLLQCLCIQ